MKQYAELFRQDISFYDDRDFLVLDIETTPILPDGSVRRIHGGYVCIVGTEDYIEFNGGFELRKILECCNRPVFVAHFGTGFDIPQLIEHGWLPESIDPVFDTFDTLVMGRILEPERLGGHSLDSYGKGKKSSYDNFEEWNDELKERCRGDVEITHDLFVKQFKKLEQDGVKRGVPIQSLLVEQEEQYVVSRQQRHGVVLDTQKGLGLLGDIEDEQRQLREDLIEMFEPNLEPVGPRAKKGLIEPVEVLKSRYGNDVIFVGNVEPWASEQYRVIPFNPTSGPQIMTRLIRRGYVPQYYTNPNKGEKKAISRATYLKLGAKDRSRSQPKSDTKTLETITGIPGVEFIQRYRLLDKRRSQVNSWIEAVTEDNKIHGYVNPIGTVTHRMAHSGPNLGQVPSSDKDPEFGPRCRSCFTVPDNFVLVGADAKGLELRKLAHYVADAEYILAICERDNHTTNAALLYQVAEEDVTKEQRMTAKTFIYAFLYGAGDTKIGSIVGGGLKEGKELRQRFFDALPGLKDLMDKLSYYVKIKQLKAIDGRWITVRWEHAVLNTLLQSAGAITMKYAQAFCHRAFMDLRKRGIYAEFVLTVHDEFQVQCQPEHAEEIAKIMVDSIIEAGVYLGLRCPLDGSYSIGSNWSETH